MGDFLIGKDLEKKLAEIIENSDEYLVLISPDIKLNTNVKSILQKVKAKENVSLTLVFGVNNDSKQNSLSKVDFEFIKEFKNLTILYNKNLLIKHYFNEKEGLLTSLSLCNFPKIKNNEYGVNISNQELNKNKLAIETKNFTNKLINETSEIIYLKKNPLKTNSKEKNKNSNIKFDVSEDFFKGNTYESKSLREFNGTNLNRELNTTSKTHKSKETPHNVKAPYLVQNI